MFSEIQIQMQSVPYILAMSKERSSQVGNRYYALLGAVPRVTRQTS